MKLNAVKNFFVGKNQIKSIYKDRKLMWSKNLKPPEEFRAQLFYAISSGYKVKFSWEKVKDVTKYNIYAYPTGSFETPTLFMEVDKDEVSTDQVPVDPDLADEITFYITSVFDEGESHRSDISKIKFSMGEFKPDIYYDEEKWRIIADWKEDPGIFYVSSQLFTPDDVSSEPEVRTTTGEYTVEHIPPLGFGDTVKMAIFAQGHVYSDKSDTIYKLVNVADTRIPTSDYTVEVSKNSEGLILISWDLPKYTKEQRIEVYIEDKLIQVIIPDGRAHNATTSGAIYLGETIYVKHYASNDIGVSDGVTSEPFYVENILAAPYVMGPTLFCCDYDNATGGGSWSDVIGATKYKAYISYTADGTLPDPMVWNVDTSDPQVAIDNRIKIVKSGRFTYAYLESCEIYDYDSGLSTSKKVIIAVKAMNDSIESDITVEVDELHYGYCMQKPT